MAVVSLRRAGVFFRWWPLALVLFAVGCEPFQGSWKEMTPHEVYSQSLRIAGLEKTVLGKAWLDQSIAVLQNPFVAATPYQEVGYLPVNEAAAIAYRIDLKRGHRLRVTVATEQTTAGQWFIDLFEVPSSDSQPIRHLVAADSTGQFLFDIPATQSYLLRIQPELLQGGRYTLAIETGASIAFPVSGYNSGAIQSFFGAPRDGGRRKHHGVDIFAPKGTPVVSSTDGIVTRVRNGGLGGKVVWVRSTNPPGNYYYAHLDEQLVRSNTRVQAGDTLGTVGNTGNARTTPPHLHFGIYSNGPHDPFPYLHEPQSGPPRVRANLEHLGKWMRLRQNAQSLRPVANTKSRPLADLSPHTTVRILGGVSNWYRVALPDGQQGYLPASALEANERPLRNTMLAAGAALLDRPDHVAATIDSVAANQEVSVLGQFGNYLHVAAPSGTMGWLQRD